MQGDEKLPSLKTLQAEQQRLLDEQQRLYDERAELKKEARIIDTMKQQWMISSSRVQSMTATSSTVHSGNKGIKQGGYH